MNMIKSDISVFERVPLKEEELKKSNTRQLAVPYPEKLPSST